MPSWLGIALVIALLGFAIFAIYRAGRKAERGEAAEKTSEIKDEQLEAGNQRRDPAAVADKLRRHDF